jgi:hypothetical protein
MSVLFSKIEPHNVPYLSKRLVRDTLSSCIVDQSILILYYYLLPITAFCILHAE